jgi:hypothetical protein
MATDGANVAVEKRDSAERSRSPSRGGEATVVSPDDLPLQLANLPEQAPNVYTYHHGPESDCRSPQMPVGDTAVWDPRGGGSFTMRLTSPGDRAVPMMGVPHEALPGGTPAAGATGSASQGAVGTGGPSGDGDGGHAPGGGGDGNGGRGGPAWDEDACSMYSFPGSSPVTVRFAEVVHWRQRVVYCRPDATIDHIKWTMRHTVGQHVSTFRIGDGFSGHPLARHWYVTGPRANAWPNFQEARRVLVVMPSFM